MKEVKRIDEEKLLLRGMVIRWAPAMQVGGTMCMSTDRYFVDW